MKFTRSFGMTDVLLHSRYELRTAVGMKVILAEFIPYETRWDENHTLLL